MSDWVKRTTIWSIYAQVILGLISFIGFAGIDETDASILIYLLVFDLSVQGVELLFYVIFSRLKERKTFYRYIDWFVSTPVMLISTAALLEYFDTKNSNVVTFDSFTSQYKEEIICIVGMNAIMLAFGLCAELDYIHKWIAVPLGSLAFVFTFTVLFLKFGYKTTEGIVLLSFMCFVWALYGVAALLEYVPKNVMYNVLDIFSKNFYGVFVGVYLLVD